MLLVDQQRYRHPLHLVQGLGEKGTGGGRGEEDKWGGKKKEKREEKGGEGERKVKRKEEMGGGRRRREEKKRKREKQIEGGKEKQIDKFTWVERLEVSTTHRRA